MKEDLTLVDSFALAEKHALWDEARRVDKAPEQPRKESAVAQKKEDEKQSGKSRQEAKHRDRPMTKESPMTKNYYKFFILIYQALCDIKNESWFKLPKQSKEDTFKLDHTKYCAFHRGPGHTIDDCFTWKNYLEKLMKEGTLMMTKNRQPRRFGSMASSPNPNT
ncbi:hypothetical protein TB2_041010 [Malus domestica]